MAYTSNVPQGNQTIAETTDPIRDNFGYLNTTLQQDHAFNNNAPGVTEGSHKWIRMPNQPGTPGLAVGTDGVLFVESNELIYQNSGATSRLSAGTPATSGFQWIGQVLLQWGRVGPNPSRLGSITYTTPFISAPFCIQLSVGINAVPSLSVSVNHTSGDPTNMGFDYAVAGGGTDPKYVYWLAIGL